MGLFKDIDLRVIKIKIKDHKLLYYTRLSKSGSYVGSWEIGRIVGRTIGSWIVRSYIV